MLIDAEEVAGGVGECCGDFWGVFADWSGDFSAVAGDCVEGLGGVVNHDVDGEGWVGCGGEDGDPGATDFADAVVEGDAAVGAAADLPIENFFVERGGGVDVEGGDDDVADFAVAEGGMGGVGFHGVG
jgi:hypothetical protein